MDMERALGVEKDRQAEESAVCMCVCERDREQGGLASRVVVDTACWICLRDTGRDVQGASGCGSDVSARVKDPGFRSRWYQMEVTEDTSSYVITWGEQEE